MPASPYVRQAAERHLRDLNTARRGRGRYYFDADAADEAIQFVQNLTHVKGSLAGQPLRLMPFQLFALANIFGWRRRRDGMRRFSRVYYETARKNGKTILGASIAMYMLCGDGEGGPEIYFTATGEEQAKTAFEMVYAMAAADTALRIEFGLDVLLDKITARKLVKRGGGRTQGRMTVLPFNAARQEGRNPSFVLEDEPHAAPNRALHDVMLDAMAAAARAQPLHMMITTPGATPEGHCWEYRSRCLEILNGVISPPEGDEVFALIAALPPDLYADWAAARYAAMGNPGWGEIVDPARWAQGALEAKRSVVGRSRFQQVRCGMWPESGDEFLVDVAAWRAAARDDVRKQGRGRACIIGLDLSTVDDMTSLAVIYPAADGHLACYGQHFIPDDAMRSRQPEQRDLLREWVQGGWLSAAHGAAIDDQEVVNAIEKIRERHGRIIRIACDPHGVSRLHEKLRRIGVWPAKGKAPSGKIPMEFVPQAAFALDEPIQVMRAALKGGRLVNDGDPCATWQIMNARAAVTLRSGRETRYLSKATATRGIKRHTDFASALVTAFKILPLLEARKKQSWSAADVKAMPAMRL